MLENLFGNQVIEKIFFYLISNEKCYASELRRRLGLPLYSIQNALGRLERGNILVHQRIGKTLSYQFNPRYPFLKELTAFLEKSYSSLPLKIREKYYEPSIRKRPRKNGRN